MGICSSLKMRFCCAGSPCGTDVARKGVAARQGCRRTGCNGGVARQIQVRAHLLGLTKASTFVSMLLSADVYWTIWGWTFAVGVVLSIYVHETGHVQALIGGMFVLSLLTWSAVPAIAR